MKLADLNLPINYSDAKEYALVFDFTLAQRLSELHDQYGTNKCRPVPRNLIDGRLMLCADVLTEIVPGGLLYDMWQAADKNILMNSVEVIPWSQALELLPKDEPEENETDSAFMEGSSL